LEREQSFVRERGGATGKFDEGGVLRYAAWSLCWWGEKGNRKRKKSKFPQKRRVHKTHRGKGYGKKTLVGERGGTMNFLGKGEKEGFGTVTVGKKDILGEKKHV